MNMSASTLSIVPDRSIAHSIYNRITMSDIVHVAVVVLVNDDDEVCISLRHKDVHQGGLWEFPGGKVEPDETVEDALIREIDEELNVQIKRFRPLITIMHTYSDKHVCLHVYKALFYSGEVEGLEGQQVKWAKVSLLSDYDFPEANMPIIKALQLPEKYLITGKFIDCDDFIRKLTNALGHGIKLVQLRLKTDSLEDLSQLQTLVEKAALLCKQADAKLMLNLPAAFIEVIDLSKIEFSGFHADSRSLKIIPGRPKGKLFSASCHNTEELARALQLKADFVVLSPVQKTASHPEMQALGWQPFSDMLDNMAVPVYALGGVSEHDMEKAWSHGAQGIAAISAFWK